VDGDFFSDAFFLQNLLHFCLSRSPLIEENEKTGPGIKKRV